MIVDIPFHDIRLTRLHSPTGCGMFIVPKPLNPYGGRRTPGENRWPLGGNRT